MSRKAILFATCVVIAAVAWLGFNPGSPQAAYQAQAEVQRWEYRLVSLNEGTREFNRLGSEGWEMCGVLGSSAPQGAIFFKRPVR